MADKKAPTKKTVAKKTVAKKTVAKEPEEEAIPELSYDKALEAKHAAELQADREARRKRLGL
jgi:hypothetical protein